MSGKVQTLTRCNATFMSTRTAAGQFKGQFKGAMAFKVSHSVGIDIDATALRAGRARSNSIGAMEEMSRQGKKASTHLSSSIGAMERFICGFDWHKNSLRPAKTKELGPSKLATPLDPT
eukprot:scaffold25400_cov73-Phaeocystis_antarctica.AAC.3